MSVDTEKKIFISYARSDVATVQGIAERLRDDFEHSAFIDDQLRAGEDWWEVILENIRACPVFLFFLSPSSVRSRACRAELAYADALGKRIVPLMIRAVRIEDAPDVLQKLNVKDFINPGDRSYGPLDTILDKAEEQPYPPLPDPMPEAPETPIADMTAARELVGRADLTLEDQRQLVAQLETQVQDEDDRPAAVAVLEQLASHPRLMEAVAGDVNELLARYRFAPRDPQSMNLLKSVVRALVDEQCIPITGSGMTDWLVGSRKTLAQAWAREYNYPLHLSQRDDLPQVAQYISVTETDPRMRQDLARFYRQQLKSKFADVVHGPVDGPQAFDLDEVIVDVWRSSAGNMPAEPHSVLAALPCSIYINAEPSRLLTEALRAEGLEPREDFCRWKPDALEEPPKSPFEVDPAYVPSIKEPLVFHIFGNLQASESIVIAEDDFFDFLGAVAERPELVPTQVREAVSASNLLFLGFGLQDWDVRVLLRALINPQTAERLGKRFKHVAADIDTSHSDGVASVDGAKEFLREYFGEFRQPKISIFWASVEAFCEGLESAWLERASEGAS